MTMEMVQSGVGDGGDGSSGVFPFTLTSTLSPAFVSIVSVSLARPQLSHAPSSDQAAYDWWRLGKVESYWCLLG